MRPGLRILQPLRHRDFRLLAMGSLVSLAGDGFFRVAIAVQVYAISNAPTSLAAVILVWATGQLVALPAGGWASDRFERRRVMIGADIARAVLMLVLGTLSVTGALQLWHLLVIGACFGISNGFFNPASSSLMPDLVPDDDLPQANAFMGMARPAMLFIVGPLLGGLVVDWTSPGMAFALDGASFVASAGMLALIPARAPALEAAEGGGFAETVAEIRAGMAHVRGQRWLWLWILAGGLGTMAFHGPFDVLVPFLLLNDLRLSEGEVARAMGWFYAAGGAGSLVASVTLAQRSLPRRFMTTLYVCEAAHVAGLIVFGLMTQMWHGVVAGFVVFTMFAVNDIVWSTSMQRLVPREMLGRVSSVDWFTAIGLAPVSFALAGLLGEAFDARTVLIAAGVLGSVVLFGLMLVPGAREPERRPGATRRAQASEGDPALDPVAWGSDARADRPGA